MAKNKNPKVSIIIPVYNGENYLEEALKSALNQTYKNIEIIVVDDGSKDKTEKICEKYKNKIKYLKKENGGVATALNLALENMTGDYFSWLSHDDLYYKNKIEEQISALEEYDDKTILFSEYDLIDKKGKVYAKVTFPESELKKKQSLSLMNGYINGITLLIPKKAFEECGNFNTNLWCTQDYDLWFKFMSKGYRFKLVNKTLASSRQHPNQTTYQSSKTLTEGNELWINMIKNMPKKLVNSEYGNLYIFYNTMTNFLVKTDYKDAYNFAKKEKEKIYNDFEVNYNDYKVSVIIPFYNNTENELERSIKSVNKQKYENVEIILVDDASTRKYKNLNEIIKKYNIKYIKLEKNSGPAKARNIGIQNATGKYVAFLDADDEFCENKLHIQIKEMLINKVNISHTSYFAVDTNRDKKYINSADIQVLNLKDALKSCRIATPTIIIDREFLIKNNLKYNVNMKIGEDTCFWLSILKLTNILGIDNGLTNVYIDDNSAAYNYEKQVEGLKNILKFILNDEKMSEFELETAHIANAYVNAVALKYKNNKSENVNYYKYLYDEMVNSKSWKITAPLRLMSKSIKTIKDSGLKSFFIKTKKYLKEKGKK